MDAKQIKRILAKKYPNGEVSPSYFFTRGKYYSGIIFDNFQKIPKGIEADPLDRGLVCVSIDESTGKIDTLNSFVELMNISKEQGCSLQKW